MAKRKLTPAENPFRLEAEVLELVIRWDRTAERLKVTGPLSHKVLCYGMLELAKETILNLHKGNAKKTKRN